MFVSTKISAKRRNLDSNTMTADFCVAALHEALAIYGPPEIFNSDQGSQFTSDNFTKVLKEAEVAISMDGVGRAIDNVFIERLWRTLKYDHIYSEPRRERHHLSRRHRHVLALLQRGASAQFAGRRHARRGLLSITHQRTGCLSSMTTNCSTLKKTVSLSNFWVPLH